VAAQDSDELSRLAPAASVAVRAIGETARAALAAGGGVARPLAGFADAPYLEAAGEIVWVGSRRPGRAEGERDVLMHPRAIVTAEAPPRGVPLRFLDVPSEGWSARLPVLAPAEIARVLAHAQRLRDTIVAREVPLGFGRLLAGRAPDALLALAVPNVCKLAGAYEQDSAEAVFDASLALLGVGSGLTPSGDDLAGAALFGRRFVAAQDARWDELGQRLAREVVSRSHRVSAALFSDLARGESFAPLHEIVDVLASGDRKKALESARNLAGIGHSSGWDMLAGLLIGMGLRPLAALAG
jgi:Protein of unknown function (DUF2877)